MQAGIFLSQVLAAIRAQTMIYVLETRTLEAVQNHVEIKLD